MAINVCLQIKCERFFSRKEFVAGFKRNLLFLRQCGRIFRCLIQVTSEQRQGREMWSVFALEKCQNQKSPFATWRQCSIRCRRVIRMGTDRGKIKLRHTPRTLDRIAVAVLNDITDQTTKLKIYGIWWENAFFVAKSDLFWYDLWLVRNGMIDCDVSHLENKEIWFLKLSVIQFRLQ